MDRKLKDFSGRHFHGTHYVISEDVDILVSRWCKSRGLTPPPKSFYAGPREKMRNFLQKLFAKVTFIDGQEIRTGLLKAITRHRKAGLKVISLERAYLEDSEVDGRIELTRTVNDDCEDIVVHGVRNGTDAKRHQFERVRGEQIALIDDVVFSGHTIIDTISDLHHYHANVHAVTTAVGVKAGVQHLKKSTFGIIGMPEHLRVDCLEEFDDVSDQVCERDFYPGVPYSGREYYLGDFSFPYILPFGRPDKWASIPEKELGRFSTLCLDNTIALFEKIESLNRRRIPCSLIPRPVFGLPVDKTRFVSALKVAREKCVAA